MMKRKRIRNMFLIFMFLSILFTMFTPNHDDIVSANAWENRDQVMEGRAESEDEENNELTLNELHLNKEGCVSSFFTYMCVKIDGKNIEKDYNVDIVPDDFAEEESLWDKFKGKIPLLGIQDDISGLISEVINSQVNTAFKVNMMMTHILAFMIDMAFDLSIIDTLIEELSSSVVKITGISTSGSIGSGGLFGQFIKIIGLSSAVYGLFLLLFKRSIIASFEVIFKTVLVIALSIVLFTNYSSFLISANSLTSQASKLILGVGAQVDDGENQYANVNGDSLGSTEATRRSNMKKNIWGLFVDRPYYYMMFGHTDIGSVDDGVTRFNDLIKYKAGTESRYAVLKDDLKDYNNTNITYSNVIERLAFTPVYFSINTMVAIPLLILVLSLLMFQIWFLIIALFAPFALIVSAIPGQFAVLKRYAIELFFPLLAKMGVTFMLLMLFLVSDVVYSLDTKIISNVAVQGIMLANPMYFYAFIGILNFVLFAVFFMLRKRLMGILMAGSEQLRNFKENQGNPLKEPFQKTMTTVGTVGGAVIGGVVSGGAGAAMGANIGRTAGGALSGKAGVEDVTRTAIQTYGSKQLASLGAKGNSGGEGVVQPSVDENIELKNNPRDIPIDNLNKSDAKAIYESLETSEKNEILSAGRNYEKQRNLQNVALSNLNEEERKQVLSSGMEESTSLDNQTFNEMSNVDKYRTLQDNKQFGGSLNVPNGRRKEPVQVNDKNMKDIMSTPISTYSVEDIKTIGEHLPEDKREILQGNLANQSYENYKHKSLGDLTEPLVTVKENPYKNKTTDDSGQDSGGGNTFDPVNYMYNDDDAPPVESYEPPSMGSLDVSSLNKKERNVERKTRGSDTRRSFERTPERIQEDNTNKISHEHRTSHYVDDDSYDE